MYYYYDGTYPGFLTAVYEIYHYEQASLKESARKEERFVFSARILL